MATNTGDRGLGSKRDVMDYKEPQGPKYRHSAGPGLRGGKNFGNVGSQGRKSLTAEGSGSPGALNNRPIHPDGYDQDDTGRL